MSNQFASLYLFINKAINKGHKRSVKAKKNILASFIIKGGSIAIGLILVPLTINYVNPTSYGIWLTLSSMVAWFGFFDIGFGHGLRNKLAESIAKEEFVLAKKYVSTTYAILSLIIGGVLVLFMGINPFLNWASILNTSEALGDELGVVALIVFSFFCMQFVLKLITTVLTANQEPAKASFFNFLGSLFSLLVIFILTKTTEGNLIYLGAALSFTPVLVLTCSSVWFYTQDYKRYAPSFRQVDFSLAKDLMSLGAKFFVIQIGALVLFSTNNVIITQLFGPEEVTPFNIAFKLFNIVTMGFGIVVTPMWSAFTDAYVREEFDWIKQTLAKMRKFWFLAILGSIGILFASPFLYRIWVGDSVDVPFELSVAMCLYVIVAIWQTMHVFFLNGIGKIKLQLYLVTFTAIINIPLAILLGRWFGLVGITMTSTLIFGIMGIVFSIQTHKILNKTAKNIWNE
ncbi:oligosaccharide flippase family protein [Cyclobacterium sp.]|uniref:lipopolysaccharide biosynthesis protein n=1 Tax=Cyclobacterium sp. TaxID=1966343 RepID=UPI00198382EB|nr:oligosaccharide flippase family protein [Cyclobacterium sp.]MBD3630240.1 polysaccharide biosynthesis protein [Cyclobacterium sp.]